MERGNDLSLSWESYDTTKDYIITYLLYQEGKSIELIAKIRNMNVERVKKQIILAKSEAISLKEQDKSMLEKMLEISKTERIKMISRMPSKDRKTLAREIYYGYNHIRNAEDKMILIWIIGELRIKELVHIVYKDIKHPHGNVRRMVCSAINKIGDPKGIDSLHKALLDSKPQVRQYAAKGLGKIGDEKSIIKMKRLLGNPNEKEYVKNAFYEAINHIERRLENS
ncbi:HEAT repeat domain-containing protein [Crassaminicella profunda]|uniref:HEAT repeat domain-containing protein n=1 Tax=Crassaminicella profunda TaxID=1286698 RepID=UPI001CA60279|nr:HEAT repeat domain-containing protein [Crassaminicella profunda]QZY56500.1 HEAT repeat domain-containing protein [Crassaminicella profunda]